MPLSWFGHCFEASKAEQKARSGRDVEASFSLFCIVSLILNLISASLGENKHRTSPEPLDKSSTSLLLDPGALVPSQMLVARQSERRTAIRGRLARLLTWPRGERLSLCCSVVLQGSGSKALEAGRSPSSVTWLCG